MIKHTLPTKILSYKYLKKRKKNMGDRIVVTPIYVYLPFFCGSLTYKFTTQSSTRIFNDYSKIDLNVVLVCGQNYYIILLTYPITSNR